MTTKFKYCLTMTYSKLKICLKNTCSCIKKSCDKLFTKKRYEIMAEGDHHIVDFPDEDIIQEQIVIEEQDTIYDSFPVSEERL